MTFPQLGFKFCIKILHVLLNKLNKNAVLFSLQPKIDASIPNTCTETKGGSISNETDENSNSY